MATTTKLIELYKQMLATAGMVVDKSGFVSTLTPGAETSKPMYVGEARLVLPTAEQLKEPDWSKRVGFHPLLQNFSAGDSPVFDALRKRANRHLDFVVGMTFLNLASMAIGGDHKGFSPEQAKYLHPYSDADANFEKVLQNIVTLKPTVKKGFEFIRVNVVMGRVWEGVKRTRTAVCSFPLYEALSKDNKPTQIATQKLTGKQVRMLREMYEMLFPHINEKGYYEYGSDSKLGPSIEALYGLFAKILPEHNKHINVLEGALVGAEYLYVPTEWTATLEDISSMASEIRAIPQLEGNAGKSRVVQAVQAPEITDVPAKPTKAAKAATVEVAKDSGVPILKGELMQETPVAAPVRPRIMLGMGAPTQVAEARSQLPDDVHIEAPTGNSIHNLNAFTPTPPVGQALAQQQALQQQAQQAQFGAVAQAATPVVSKIPDAVRMVNGAMYIPLEVTGVGAPPAGALVIEGKLYVPYGQQVAQQPMQQQMVAGQQQAVDPAQVPGLSPQEVQMYRSNPALWMAYLRNQMAGSNFGGNPNAALQQQARPAPYLQRLMEQANQVQQQNRFGAIR